MSQTTGGTLAEAARVERRSAAAHRRSSVGLDGAISGWFAHWWPAALAVAGYVVLSFVVYGIHSPVSTSTLPSCGCGDISQEVWFLTWPAQALAHGHNLLFTDYLNHPRGVNLMQNTSMPLLGVVSSPVTLLVGPVATYNLLMRLALALSATAMLFVLRRWTQWWPAAIAGGLLYGFSPFMIGQAQSHLFLTFVPLPPLILLLLDTLLTRRRSPLRTGVLLGVVCATQLLISAEVLAITALLVGIGLVVVAVRHPVAACELWRELVVAGAAALCVFLAIASYPLWLYAWGPGHIVGPPHPISALKAYHSDPALLLQPSPLFRIGFGHWQTRATIFIEGNLVEQTDYVGVPLLLLLAFLAVRVRRVGMAQLAVVVGTVSWVLTLGSTLWFRGMPRHVTLPFSWLLHVPVLNGIEDLRYSLGMYTCIAILLAIGLDRLQREGVIAGFRSGPARATPAPDGGRALRGAVLLLVTAAALVPLAPRVPFPATAARAPEVFTSDHSTIRPGSVVVGYPMPGSTGSAQDQLMLWQAQGGMRYKIIGGRAAVAGPDGRAAQGVDRFLPPPALQDLFSYAVSGTPAPPPPADAATYADIRRFLARYHVATIAVVPIGGSALVDQYLTAALHRPPVLRSGAEVWTDVQRDLRTRIH